MAKHVIEIDPFDPQSVDAALKEVKAIQKSFDKKVSKFMDECVKIVENAAREGYEGKVKVEAQQVGDNEWAIVASHKALIFFEFGAGDDTLSQDDRYAGEMGFTVAKGSWSQEHAQEYSTQGYWTFGGRKYTEVKQLAGMQKAYDAIESQWQEVAKEIFG